MDKLVVIKIGGQIIDDHEKLSSFLKKFAAIPSAKILVHGGGKLATEMAAQLNIPQQMTEGRRITDAETLKVVTMVYAGLINKNIVAQLQALGSNAIGLSGADGNVIMAHKRIHSVTDFGFVGDIDLVNTKFLKSMLHIALVPVMAPVTHDGKGQLLNTNADTIAQEIARSLSTDYEVELVYSFEKKGVMLDVNDESTVIHKLNASSYLELKKEGKVFAGMIPKLDNAFAALDHGVNKVIIGKAEEIDELLTGQNGTHISNG